MRIVPRRMTAGLVVAMAAAVLITACAPRVNRQKLHAVHHLEGVPTKAPFLKAHHKDGRVSILGDWRIDEVEQQIHGEGVVLDARRDTLATGRQTIAIDDVAIVESNTLVRSPSIAPMFVMTGISLSMTAYCIANPKACFGCCPTFWSMDDGTPRLVAEGFSASVAPALERDDLDALHRCRPGPGPFALTLTNEALETHVIRRADLLVADCPPSGRVFADPSGVLHPAAAIVDLLRATAPEGDVTALLCRLDDVERCSPADSNDLAAREHVVLDFPAPEGSTHGLVLAFRQSLLTTFLFYQALAYLGEDATALLAHASPGHWYGSQTPTIGGLLGDIEVQAQGASGDWHTVGRAGETGPLAVNVIVVPLPLGAAIDGRLRLRLTRGHWRLDWVALATLEGSITPRRVPPMQVLRDHADDVAALHALNDPAAVLVTMPGDRLELIYELPADMASPELFLDARGYYLEWMREAWLAEADRTQAAIMLTRPALALRLHAPQFKAIESEVEDLFWGSRYAP